MTPREALIEKIRLLGMPDPDHVPVVSLDEFFIGNDDYGSIGCNLSDHPGPQAFYTALKAIRAHPDVQDVRVGITEVEESDPAMWPFSDHIYLLARAPEQDVAGWLASLQADEVGEVFEGMGTPVGLPDPLPGYRVFFAWWD